MVPVIVQLIVPIVGHHGLKLEERHLERHLDLELPAERELEVPLAVGPLFNGRFP